MMEVYGTEGDRPQSDHYTIYEMIQECELSEKRIDLTPKQIAEKLTTNDNPVSEARAKERLKQTKSFFSGLA